MVIPLRRAERYQSAGRQRYASEGRAFTADPGETELFTDEEVLLSKNGAEAADYPDEK